MKVVGRQFGLGSILILRAHKLATMSDFYSYSTWLVIVLSPFVSLFAYIACYLELPYWVSPDSQFYRVKLEIYEYPDLKYWLNLQTAFLMPVLIALLYIKSFAVQRVGFEEGYTWGKAAVLFAAGVFLISTIYFGVDGKEGYLSRGTTSNQFGIQVINHLSLLGGVILNLIPLIYLTWRLGIYHGRAK